ncbi:hypothetical protein BCV72DRAFT_276877 [Rhizopus microsporus var. microsporus]|uniref:Uncharacterized protein n=2 Tax=Rhizopus microsporus TaxID=58291 RepID=A0A2G4SFL7_RHIZD|nr:uncharacterized protein RHIMIDRAFT_274377 [Rhizopus microsporus ATCC 52813]ORE05034.1 hypothetical protein BCV72DRAFT_276877 [Rhizopus microsporus var. microsporus]PHZ07557.1 hypothetical protein RHIMIDRAFT_274377 [Rhizopus microsporus ATCC 52813]
MFQRDKVVNCLLLEQLKDCDGSIQDLIYQLESKFSKARLVVLDYASLLTNVDDSKSFWQTLGVIKNALKNKLMLWTFSWGATSDIALQLYTAKISV